MYIYLEAMVTEGRTKIALYFIGITACFSLYSLIQERLMTIGFGEDKEIFRYSVFIVLVNRLVTILTSAGVLLVLGLPLEPSAPTALFAVPSLANVIGSAAQYEALKYVSFPLQALAKCAKSVPVMAWSWVTSARKYYLKDYLAAGVVTFGCALFVLTGDISSPTLPGGLDDDATRSSMVFFTTTGLVLLSVFIVFDGLTCTVQDKLFSSYDMHSCNQLLYVSCWSALVSAGFLVATGQMKPALSFVYLYPESLQLMLLQSCVSTTVQLFISFTIKQYGALNFALMMTLRQFLSIVLSCFVFKHELSILQWTGTVFVISGLLTRTLQNSSRLASKAGAHMIPIKRESKDVN